MIWREKDKIMNDHKFCFIICTNDALYLEEAMVYLDNLVVPEGYETELLLIEDAAAMTQGYQEAMEQSDARYKIYMHQDVFILNKYILVDLLDIFQSDAQIGMVGMVGYQRIAADGVMWHVINREGGIYERHPRSAYPELSSYRYSMEKDGIVQVALIDGLFMATSRDLHWDTEKLLGWDFYDAYQSMHFMEEGMRVVVPVQRHPWCLHDDNILLNMFNYAKYRDMFMKDYAECLGKRYDEIQWQ